MRSGYKTVTPIQLANVLFSLDKGVITRRCVRVYFACLAAVAVREAATRSQKKKGRKPRELPRYRVEELSRLTGMPPKAVKRSLKRLKRAGILSAQEGRMTFKGEPLQGSEELLEKLSCSRSSRRPIPFPRSVLRFLAREKSPSVIKTIIAYALRGLSLSRVGEISGRGTVKISWIVEVTGLSERAARGARGRLIELGWIDRDLGSTQRKLNRTGAYFSINLDWTFVNRGKKNEQAKPNFAPLPIETCSVFAPPYKDKKTSIEDKNQKTRRAIERPGVCLKEEKIPSLSDIKPEDLFHFGRLESLYAEAVKAKWIEPSEAAALNFISAAVRAREVGRDPARVFVTIVRRKLWHHITNAEEERARKALLRFREADPERFRPWMQTRVAA